MQQTHCLGHCCQRLRTMVAHRSYVLFIKTPLSGSMIWLRPSKIQFKPRDELQLHWICQKGGTKQLPIWHGWIRSIVHWSVANINYSWFGEEVVIYNNLIRLGFVLEGVQTIFKSSEFGMDQIRSIVHRAVANIN